MKKEFKVISLITILALVLSIGMVGCTTRQPAKPNTPYNNQTNRNLGNDGTNNDMNRNNMDGTNTDMNGTTMDGNLNNRNIVDNNINNSDEAMSDQAKAIADKVTDLAEVQRATVVISGTTALVGVTINDNVEGNITTNLKNKIEKVVKNSNNNINTVSVTASPDLYKRIENVGNDVRTGKPLSGFAEEIEEIIRRITPTM